MTPPPREARSTRPPAAAAAATGATGATGATDQPGASVARPGLLLLVLCLAQFMLVLDVSVTNVALSSIRADLDFAVGDLQWIITAYTLVFGSLLIFFGAPVTCGAAAGCSSSAPPSSPPPRWRAGSRRSRGSSSPRGRCRASAGR
jgi:hypothetical protein